MATWSNGVTVVGESPFRKVVATRPLRRGDTILRERPTLTLLQTKQWGVRCNRCFAKAASTSKLLRCSRCRRFHYCTKACQRADWKKHKEECTALSRRWQHDKNGSPTTGNSEEEGLLADALLVARAFRLRDTKREQFETIMDLVFHQDCIQPTHHRIAQLVDSMGLLQNDNNKSDVGSNNAAISTTEIIEMLARFDSNNFGIVDELLFFLGAGVYPAGAMLNHSCDHNCAIMYEPKTHTQVIRCLVDVTQGDELYHPYIDFASTSQQRRAKLQTTYGFDCQCARCCLGDDESDGPSKWTRADIWLTAPVVGMDQATASRTIAVSEQWMQQAAMTDDIGEELRLVQQCVTARAKVLHPRHLSLYQARSQLHTTAMAAGELSVARDQCLEIVKTMEKCFYRPEHPLMGVMLYTLGSLHHSLNDFPEAIECYEKALPVLRSYHGKDHQLTTGCQDYLQQARQEAG